MYLINYIDWNNVFLFLGELVGHNCGEVPWKRGNFEAVGMPEGIPLKKPCFYGSRQVQAIMKKSDDIKFIFKEDNGTEEEEEDTEITLEITVADAKAVLGVVIGEEAAATHALNNGRKELLDEHEVEVQNLKMPNSELHFKLHMCDRFFTKDGALAICSNMAHSEVVGDLVLPTYTTESPFWLFYCKDSPANIVSMNKKKSSSRICGHWFDLDFTSGQYTIQKAKSSIAARSIINSSVGGIVYHQCNSVLNDPFYKPPIDMVNAINYILTQQGFL